MTDTTKLGKACSRGFPATLAAKESEKGGGRWIQGENDIQGRGKGIGEGKGKEE